MRIFVKNNAVAKYQHMKKISPISARRTLIENINTEKGNLEFGRIQDKAQSVKNLKKWQTTYDSTRPEKLDSSSENIMWKRAKFLKDEFTIGMLSRDELHPVKQFEQNGTIVTVVNHEKIRTLRTVERESAWDKKNKDKVKEFKNIMRHLNPNNPNASDIEKFRPRRSNK